MPDYTWICHSCKATDQPGEEICRRCGFPAVATGSEIDEAVTGVKRQPALSRKELQRQRRAEIAALSIWKKPFAYALRAVQFVGGLVFFSGIFDLSGSEMLLGLASGIVAEVLYQLLKGRSDTQPTSAQ
ncbi:MAG: hypothetical protein ACM31P_13310 [Actinomycetota bacterium]